MIYKVRKERMNETSKEKGVVRKKPSPKQLLFHAVMLVLQY